MPTFKLERILQMALTVLRLGAEKLRTLNQKLQDKGLPPYWMGGTHFNTQYRTLISWGLLTGQSIRLEFLLNRSEDPILYRTLIETTSPLGLEMSIQGDQITIPLKIKL